MKKKTTPPRPRFPKEREEFAGELTPGVWPGPITRAHPGRFAHPEEERQPPERQEDTGIWTPEV